MCGHVIHTNYKNNYTESEVYLTMNKSLKQNKKLSNKQSGFTLIEMIVTVAIAAILASIAIPSFTKMIERNRISTGTNEFLGALIFARSEAVKRSQNVTVCVSNAAQTDCETDSTKKVEFSNGWLVFVECGVADGTVNTGNICDLDNDAATAKTPEEILKVHGALPQLSIKSGTINNITFQPSGRADSLNFNIGKDSNTHTKKIEISLTGRVRSSTQ